MKTSKIIVFLCMIWNGVLQAEPAGATDLVPKADLPAVEALKLQNSDGETLTTVKLNRSFMDYKLPKEAPPVLYTQSNEVLRELVREKGHGPVNHLYVSPIKQMGKDEFAWVYWKEERLLILWAPYDPSKWKLSWSRRILNLDKDVVPTAADIGSSTYLVDEEWACRTIGDCMKNGREAFFGGEATSAKP